MRRLLARIRHPRAAPVVAAPGPQCQGTTRTGRRCKLPAGADGYCQVFHRAGPRGPRAA